MATEFDASDFVDSDFNTTHAVAAPLSPNNLPGGRPPTREELDRRVNETQLRLSELKRAQDELERARTALEEARRRRVEFQTGRNEIMQNLTRGVGILEETEFATRRDADQMAKTLADLKEGLAKVQSIHDESWTKENYQVELTRALTVIENARMEWNSARLKWPRLSGPSPTSPEPTVVTGSPFLRALDDVHWIPLAKIGLALTWPLVFVAFCALGLLLVLVARH
jgi:hypothetical protein